MAPPECGDSGPGLQNLKSQAKPRMDRHQNKYPRDCEDLGVTASSGD